MKKLEKSADGNTATGLIALLPRAFVLISPPSVRVSRTRELKIAGHAFPQILLRIKSYQKRMEVFLAPRPGLRPADPLLPRAFVLISPPLVRVSRTRELKKAGRSFPQILLRIKSYQKRMEDFQELIAPAENFNSRTG